MPRGGNNIISFCFWLVGFPFIHLRGFTLVSPWPAVQCVYVWQRRELDFRGRKVHVVLAKTTSVPQFPERSDFIRVSQCQVKLAAESNGSNQSKGKRKASVGVLLRPAKYEQSLWGTYNAWCIFPEVREWAWVQRKQRRLSSPLKFGYNAWWMFKSDQSIFYLLLHCADEIRTSKWTRRFRNSLQAALVLHILAGDGQEG